VYASVSATLSRPVTSLRAPVRAKAFAIRARGEPMQQRRRKCRRQSHLQRHHTFEHTRVLLLLPRLLLLREGWLSCVVGITQQMASKQQAAMAVRLTGSLKPMMSGRQHDCEQLCEPSAAQIMCSCCGRVYHVRGDPCGGAPIRSTATAFVDAKARSFVCSHLE